MAAMEAEMLAKPGYWSAYYQGEPDYQRALRHFSYSDRIRYYWAAPEAQEAVERLLDRLMGTSIPEPLISQFLPTLYPRVAGGALDPVPGPWCSQLSATYFVFTLRRVAQRGQRNVRLS